MQKNDPAVFKIMVPALFFDDYGDRFPDDGTTVTEVSRHGNRVLICGSAEQIAKLRADAEYYCDKDGPDDCLKSIKRSAAATIRAIDINMVTNELSESTTLTALGGEVHALYKPYSVTYTVDASSHPAFDNLSDDDFALLLHGWPRREGTKLTCGGCNGWKAEEFLEMVLHHLDLGKSFAAVLSEDNFITRQFSVDPETAAKRITEAAKLRLKEAREAIFGDDWNSCDSCGSQQCASLVGADCPLVEYIQEFPDPRPLRIIRREYWKRNA